MWWDPCNTSHGAGSGLFHLDSHGMGRDRVLSPCGMIPSAHIVSCRFAVRSVNRHRSSGRPNIQSGPRRFGKSLPFRCTQVRFPMSQIML